MKWWKKLKAWWNRPRKPRRSQTVERDSTWDGKAIGDPPSDAMLRQVEDGYAGAATRDYAASNAPDPSASKLRIIKSALSADWIAAGWGLVGNQGLDLDRQGIPIGNWDCCINHRGILP